MPGFEEYRIKSIRNDPDWKDQYVSYAELKANLRTFLRRRTYFTDLAGTGSAITVEDFDNARVFQPNKISGGYLNEKKRGGKKVSTESEENLYGNYHRFEDESDKGMVSA